MSIKNPESMSGTQCITPPMTDRFKRNEGETCQTIRQHVRVKFVVARVAKLADAPDLGSGVPRTWRFKSSLAYHTPPHRESGGTCLPFSACLECCLNDCYLIFTSATFLTQMCLHRVWSLGSYAYTHKAVETDSCFQRKSKATFRLD